MGLFTIYMHSHYGQIDLKCRYCFKLLQGSDYGQTHENCQRKRNCDESESQFRHLKIFTDEDFYGSDGARSMEENWLQPPICRRI